MHTADIIRMLNQLISMGRDGEEFCRSAGAAAGTELAPLLRQGCEEWGRLSDELQALVLMVGGAPATGGTLAASALHLGLALRARLLGHNDSVVLEHWERLERDALGRYEQALAAHLPARIRRTIALETDRVLARLDQVSRLRGQYIVHSPSG